MEISSGKRRIDLMSKSIAIIDGQVLSRKNFMDAIDQEIIHLHDTGNINQVMNVLNGLNAIEEISGHAKAKLLYAANEWYKINRPNNDFGDHVESTTTTKRVTVLRYVNVWKQIEQENIPKHIQDRPMRELVPIANMISQGFVPSKTEWDKIDLCSNQHELGEVISKIKGTKRRKTARKIVMERDGSINLWKEDKKKYLGFLDVEEALMDEDVAKAIEYILDGRITKR